MKKNYSAPEAELVQFYSDEEITANDEALSEDLGTTDLPQGWS